MRTNEMDTKNTYNFDSCDTVGVANNKTVGKTSLSPSTALLQTNHKTTITTFWRNQAPLYVYKNHDVIGDIQKYIKTRLFDKRTVNLARGL